MRLYRVCGQLILLLLAIAIAPAAMAAINSPTCPADTSGGKILSCTSKDIQIALVSARSGVGNPTQCLVGTEIGLALEVEFATNAESGSPNVGIWFAQDAKNLLIPSDHSSGNGAADCRSSALPFGIDALSGNFPNIVDDYDIPAGSDLCGDVASGSKGEEFIADFGTVSVSCDGAAGGAEIDALVSWHEKKHPVCDDVSTTDGYGGFNTSKCNLSTTFFPLDVFGKLTIVKAASTSGVEFDYNSTGTVSTQDLSTAITEFSLLSNGNGLSLAAPTGQPVSITETEFDDWKVSDISCVNNDPRAAGVPVIFTRENNVLNITLTKGNLATSPEAGTEDYGQSDVTCTFTNTEGGSITIIKDTVPDGGQDFSYSGSGPDGFNFGGGFTLDDDTDDGLSNTAVFDNLAPGSYTLTETQIDGFDLTGLSCNVPVDKGDYGFTVVMIGSLDVVCTFVNTQRGGIIVAKQTEPDGDEALFEFSGDASGVIGDNGTIEVMNLRPGAYTSEETIAAGWDLVSIVCNDDNSGANDLNPAQADFVVDPGEIVTCTFLNIKQGSIVVNKTAIGDDGTFSFERSWGADFDIATTAGTGSASFNNLSASDEVANATYSVSEITEGLDRWTYDGVVCTGNDGVEDNGAIDLDPGETVNCVFTNTKWSSLTLVKQAYGPDDEFCFSVGMEGYNTANHCLVTNEGSGTWEYGDNIELGDYLVAELLEEGSIWILAQATCDNGDSPEALTITAGEDVTCKFVNTIPAPVPVNDKLALLLLTLMLLATGWYFRPISLRKI